MKPAARLGDKTGHGAVPLTPMGAAGGSQNVLIGDRPAWRAWIDAHSCPLSSGPVAHVGGVVLFGSTTVLVNDVPAARMGDNLVEVGPPNPIVEGCQSVLIGG
jgi:uncharacterized Zn-binding protein involved in type VI secretion